MYFAFYNDDILSTNSRLPSSSLPTAHYLCMPYKTTNGLQCESPDSNEHDYNYSPNTLNNIKSASNAIKLILKMEFRSNYMYVCIAAQRKQSNQTPQQQLINMNEHNEFEIENIIRRLGESQ